MIDGCELVDMGVCDISISSQMVEIKKFISLVEMACVRNNRKNEKEIRHGEAKIPN